MSEELLQEAYKEIYLKQGAISRMYEVNKILNLKVLELDKQIQSLERKVIKLEKRKQ